MHWGILSLYGVILTGGHSMLSKEVSKSKLHCTDFQTVERVGM